jgi:hypothetical protein
MQNNTLTFPLGRSINVTIHDRAVPKEEIEVLRHALHRQVVELSAKILNIPVTEDVQNYQDLFFDRRHCQDIVELLDGISVPIDDGFVPYPSSSDNVHINGRRINDMQQKVALESMESYRDNYGPEEVTGDINRFLQRARAVTRLNHAQLDQVENHLRSARSSGNEVAQFVIGRAKYMWLLRLQGKTDEEIAKEVTVEYRDGGEHVRQIFHSIGVD